MKDTKPILAVTMGDPAGIGPEICARALGAAQALDICRPVLIGDMHPMRRALAACGLNRARLREIERPQDAVFEENTINVIAAGAARAGGYEEASASAAAGRAAFEYVRRAIELAMDGGVDGTVTAPLCKESLNMAGLHYAGHTEIYAQLTGCKKYAMMLAHHHFRVVHVSTHVSLREACDRVTRARVLDTIRLADSACRALGIARPRVAVAGLNPHCGEGGLFGREEIDEIAPAVSDARESGIDAQGPIPPDTVYSKLNAGMYDICVAMYHDQGHIPTKLLGFAYDAQAGRWQSVCGVNITLGLPIVRVSVDHGTAFDIAYRGVASPDSLFSALAYAAQLCAAR